MHGNKALISYPDFDRLIPKPLGITETVKRRARLEDTLDFLPDGIRRSQWQVKEIAPLVKGKTIEETCYNIWYRLYTGIRYQKDDEGKEQIRSPRSSWWGRRADCDDYSVFVSCLLSQLGIDHLLRITENEQDRGYQHIYPVALLPDGSELIIDCVLNQFNKQAPYFKKIDKKMELQFLDGFDLEPNYMNGIDAEDLLRGNLGELGKRFKDTKLGKGLKNALHVVNRVNPVTALLRNGLLLCMKLNLLGVAGNLRYTYLSDEQAKQKGFNMPRFARLKNVRDKLEKIFFGAGGKPENLKKAILNGKGNRNKEVSLNGFEVSDLHNYTIQSTPIQILGQELYQQEFSGMEGLGSLGVEPVTDTAIATAMSALTAIAAIIKSIGPVKGGGSKSSDAASADAPVTNTDGSDSNSKTDAPATDSSQSPTPTGEGANTDTPPTATGKDSQEDLPAGSANNSVDKVTGSSTDPTAGATPKKGFTQWVKANKVLAGTVGFLVLAGLSYGGYRLATKGKKKTNGATEDKAEAMAGVPKGRKKGKRKRHNTQGKLKIQKLR